MTTQYIAFDRNLLKHVIRQSTFEPPAADFTSGGGWTPVDLNENHWQMPLFKDKDLQNQWAVIGFDEDPTNFNVENCMTIKPEFLFDESTEEFVFILESQRFPPDANWGAQPEYEMFSCLGQADDMIGKVAKATTSDDWITKHPFYDPTMLGTSIDSTRSATTRAQHGREMGWPSLFVMVFGSLSRENTHYVDITNVLVLPTTYQQKNCGQCAEQTVIDMRLAWDTNNTQGDKGLLFSILADGSVAQDADGWNDFVNDDKLTSAYVQNEVPLPRLLVQEFGMNGRDTSLKSVCNNENPPMWFIDSLDHGTSYAEPGSAQDARTDTRHLNIETISAIMALDGRTPENYFYQDSSGQSYELNTQYTHLLYGIYRHAPCELLYELDQETCVHKRAQQGSATLGADGDSVCASITNPSEQVGTQSAVDLCRSRQEYYGHGFFYLNIDQTRQTDRICLVVGGDQVMPSAGVEECVPTREWLDLQMIRNTRLRQYFPENFANMNPDNFNFWDTEHCVRAWNPLVTRGEDQDQYSMGRRPDKRAAHFMIPERPTYTHGKRLSHHDSGKWRVDSREQSIYVGQINSGGQAWKLNIRQSSLDVSDSYAELNLPEIEPYEFEWRVGPYWPFYDSIQSIKATRPGFGSNVKFIDDDFTGVVTGQDFRLPRPLNPSEGVGDYHGRISYNNSQIPYISIRPPRPISIKDQAAQAFQNAWNKAFQFQCSGRCQVPKGAPKWLNLKEGARTRNRNTMRRTYSTHLTTELINSSNEGSHESLKAIQSNPPTQHGFDMTTYYDETIDDEWLWPFDKLYVVDKETGRWRAPIYQDDQEGRKMYSEKDMNFWHRRYAEDNALPPIKYGREATGMFRDDTWVDGDFAYNIWVPDTNRLNGKQFELKEWVTGAGLYASAELWWSGSDAEPSNMAANDVALPWMKFGRYPDIDINGIKYPLPNRIGTGLLIDPNLQNERSVYNTDGMFQPTDMRTAGNWCKNQGGSNNVSNISNVNSTCVPAVAMSDTDRIMPWTDQAGMEDNQMLELTTQHPVWTTAHEADVIYYMNYNLKIGPSVYEDGLDWSANPNNTEIGYLPGHSAPGWFLGCAPHAKWEAKNEGPSGAGPQRYRLFKCGHSPSRIHVGEIEMTQGNVWSTDEDRLVYHPAAHLPNWTSEFHDQMLHLSIIHPYQYAWDEVNMWSESYYNQPGYLFLYPNTTSTTTTDYFMTTTPPFYTLDPTPAEIEPTPAEIDPADPQFRSVIGRASLQLGQVVLLEDEGSTVSFAIAAAGVAAAALVGGIAMFAMPNKIMKIEVPIEPSEIGQKFD